jgi:gliding motility-associated-like protein
MINGVPQLTSGFAMFTAAVLPTDVVSCGYDDSSGCVTNAPVVAKPTLPPGVNPSVTIAGPSGGACVDSMQTFAATAVDAGAKPNYQWAVNGSDAGSDSDLFSSSTLKNGDVVTCVLTADTANTCSVGVKASSNPVVAVILASPVVTVFPADTSVSIGTALALRGEASGVVGSIQWTPANLLTDSQSLAPLTNSLTDSVTFILAVTGTDGCVGTSSAKVLVFRGFALPNAFTPNGDGKDDVFRIPPFVNIHLAEFEVFDRWGTRVFATQSISQGWDGTFAGHPAPAGTYVYYINGTDTRGAAFTRKGTVLLVR